MAQLYFKRAKIFMHTTPNGESKRFSTGVSAGPIAVPDWVRETETYKYGVKDKSIIDLTPARHRAPAKEKEAKDAQAAKTPDLGVDPVIDEPAAAEVGDGEESGQEPAGEASDDAIEPAKPPANALPQKTPKGFTTQQPTAMGKGKK